MLGRGLADAGLSSSVLGPRFRPFRNDAAARARDLGVPGASGDLLEATGPPDAGGASSRSSSPHPPETPRALSADPHWSREQTMPLGAASRSPFLSRGFRSRSSFRSRGGCEPVPGPQPGSRPSKAPSSSRDPRKVHSALSQRGPRPAGRIRPGLDVRMFRKDGLSQGTREPPAPPQTRFRPGARMHGWRGRRCRLWLVVPQNPPQAPGTAVSVPKAQTGLVSGAAGTPGTRGRH